MVQPGVRNQPGGAEVHRLEIADPAERIVGVEAHFVRDLLGIKTPAFGIGVETQQGADQRQIECIFALPDMARNPLVEGQRRQCEARPDAGVAQVDVIGAGDFPVHRSRPGITVRRAVLDRGRHALDVEVAAHQLAERFRHQRPDLRDDAVEIGEQLGAARIGVGEQQIGALAELREPLAGGALRQALRAQQRVHLRRQRLALIEAGGVNFFWRAFRGGAGLDQPAIDILRIGHPPHAGDVWRFRTERDEGVGLRGEGGGDLLLRDAGGAGAPFVGQGGGAQLRADAGDDRPFRRLRRPVAELARGDVVKKAGEIDALRRVRLHPLGLVAQLLRIGAHPGEIGFGVGAGCDLVFVLQQVRHVDERAIALADDIGRRAIAVGGKERHVAHRHPPPAVERDLMRDSGGFDMGGDGGGKVRQVDRAQFGQAAGGVRLAPCFARDAMIAQHGLERGALARVDAEEGGLLGIGREQRLRVPIEQRHRGRVARCGGGGAEGEGGGGAERGGSGDEPTAVDPHGGHPLPS